MPLVQNLRHHDYQFEFPTPPVGKWRWTTRLDVSQSVPAYSIRDIISPYGLLRDSIPIPGAIIQEMAQSIAELSSNFVPSILVGPPTQLVFTVVQGFGVSDAQSVIVTNDGVYGSILGAGLTSSAQYVSVTPATVGNLAINESGEFLVEVDSTNLVVANSPYSETITLQDPTATNNPQVLPIQINVIPVATIASDVTSLSFNVSRPLDGSAFPAIATQVFNLQNSGPSGSILTYNIRSLTGMSSNWLNSWLPSSGTLSSGQAQAIVVTVRPNPNLLQGTYSELLRISGYSTNTTLDVAISLVIS